MAFDRILVIDDEAVIRKSITAHFQQRRYVVASAGSLEEGKKYLEADSFDFVLLDERLPDGKGTDFLEFALRLENKPFVVMMSGYSSVQEALQAIRKGAFDYVLKPFSMAQIEISLKRAESFNQLLQVNRFFNRQLNKESELIGNSAGMIRMKKILRKVASTEATVLITGENGTGKEVVAQELYRLSNLRDKPFIRVNCAAISENLIESEFFGHEKGAFTGATQRKPGRFELANEGTILLDEIGEISPRIQAKLLRVLQEKEFERVGGTKTISVKVRVIASTNKNLIDSVEKGEFREDLYYRLSVFPIEVPPLRDRDHDIILLARTFLKRFAAKHEVGIQGFAPSAENALLSHTWPGNVREMENTIERAVILSDDGDSIEAETLQLQRTPQTTSPFSSLFKQPQAQLKESPQEVASPPENSASSSATSTLQAPPMPSWTSDNLPSMEDLERDHIFRALEVTEGNRTQAAELLKITSRTLRNKLNLYRENGYTIPATH